MTNEQEAQEIMDNLYHACNRIYTPIEVKKMIDRYNLLINKPPDYIIEKIWWEAKRLSLTDFLSKYPIYEQNNKI